jgi:hypothetical protein
MFAKKERRRGAGEATPCAARRGLEADARRARRVAEKVLVSDFIFRDEGGKDR